MAKYLSEKNKKQTSVITVFLFTIFIIYIYDINNKLQDNIIQSYKSSIVSDYFLYIKSGINKDILIKDEHYVDTSSLIDEYAKSTPIIINKQQKILSKYNLTIKNFDKNTTYSDDIKNKIDGLQNKEYICFVKENSIELFAHKDSGYILITKQLQNSSFIITTLNNIAIGIFFIGFINLLIFLYFIKLFNEHEKDKKSMYSEYEQLSQDAQAIARVDALTGAATRVKFNDDLDELIQLASRFDEQKFTFMILDIDNFKSVNDTYGHDYGDLVLKEISKIIKQHIRKTDHFYRWGGEEFVIMMPMNSLKNSIDYANILRENISQIKFEKLKQITCSFGLIEFKKGDDEKTIIKRADELLYKAKQNGKNRVEY
ncbi:MAG: GGDEF domain-containing protein [Campylobacterota bacterium]|nr:GGDEF domain-containing protein [Campylobacterota bacterium]